MARTQNSRLSSVWTWACAGACVGSVTALLILAPARWLAGAVHQFSHGQLQLSQAEGTVWAGTAQLALADGSGPQAAVRLPGRMQWQMRVGWSHIAIQLQASCCTAKPIALTLTPRWKRLQLALADGESIWPARLFSGLGAPWNTVQLDGELRVVSKGVRAELTADHLFIDGDLRLEARDLSSPLSSLRPMGSYRLTLGGGAQPSLRLETLGGGLQLSGQGGWTGWHLRFDGTASAAPAHEVELSNLLNIIGRRDGARSILKAG